MRSNLDMACLSPDFTSAAQVRPCLGLVGFAGQHRVGRGTDGFAR